MILFTLVHYLLGLRQDFVFIVKNYAVCQVTTSLKFNYSGPWCKKFTGS